MNEETLHPASVELETQLRRLETIVDPASRSTATDLVAAVLRFHTAALERMLELIRDSESGGRILSGCDRDPLVRSMLLVHDLHPDPVSARVRRALAEAKSMLQKRGAVAELLDVDADRVHVRISGGEPGRGTFAPAVEKLVRSAVPEIVSVVVEDSAGAAPTSGFVPLGSIAKVAPANFADSIQK
jgi:hypothetical protein